MNEQLQMLEVVDDNDNIIGLETRKKVHEKGLLHREIHIWFITPSGEAIFQHRSKSKDTYPDKLDAAVGGHVEPNMSYEETAIKECYEETGIKIDPTKLVFITKMKRESSDKASSHINNAIRSQYAFLYDGSTSDLKIEGGESYGFEAWKIDDLSHLSEIDRNKFIPHILGNEVINVLNKAKELLSV